MIIVNETTLTPFRLGHLRNSQIQLCVILLNSINIIPLKYRRIFKSGLPAIEMFSPTSAMWVPKLKENTHWSILFRDSTGKYGGVTESEWLPASALPRGDGFGGPADSGALVQFILWHSHCGAMRCLASPPAFPCPHRPRQAATCSRRLPGIPPLLWCAPGSEELV